MLKYFSLTDTGEGQFGRVFKAIAEGICPHDTNRKVVAVKTLKGMHMHSIAVFPTWPQVAQCTRELLSSSMSSQLNFLLYLSFSM